MRPLGVTSLAQPHRQGPGVTSSVSGGGCIFEFGGEHVQNLQESTVSQMHTRLEQTNV